MAYKAEYEESSVDAEFKQKINVEFLTLKQIDRCNNAALEGDEIKFANAVEGLLAMLPKENRIRIENEKTKEQYVTKVEQPVYKYSCGKPMGTIENPIFRNKKSDWNYDGGEPIRISPMIEEVEQTDYQKLYKIILNELQDVGVTWKIEPRGNVEKRIDPPPIPLLKLKDGSFVRVLIEKGIEGVKEGIVSDKKTEQRREQNSKPEIEPVGDAETETETDTEDQDGDGEEDGQEPDSEVPEILGEDTEEETTDETDELEIDEDKDVEKYKEKQKSIKESKQRQIVNREEFAKDTERKLEKTQEDNIELSTESTTIDDLPKLKIPKPTKKQRVRLPRLSE